MNTGANFQVFPSPNAFGPKRRQFRDLMLRDGKKIISQQFMQLDPTTKGKLKQNIIQGIFNVEIKGIDLSDLDLKPCLRCAFSHINQGKSPQDAVKKAIIQNVGRYGN